MLDKYIIMSRTDAKGIITRVSEAFCQISGYRKEELIGNTHNILRDPDVHNEFYEHMWRVLKSGRVWKGELKNRNKKGEVYWVYATIEPHFNDEGEILYYDAIRQDITLKKEVEEQHHLLIEQSKYITMSEVISMIAHQWRQPLQAVAILIQKLPITKMIEGEITNELLDQTVEDVSLQLNYMSNTIDDFREFFKPSEKKTVVQLSDVVNKSISFLSYMFNANSIVLNIERKEDTQIILYDREVIQVLINIMKNAKDILQKKHINKKQLYIRYYAKKNRAIIEIEDNAGGIPLDIINRIFEPYFSTKENKNGTGLGLYMSKMIIEEHSLGHLSVKNAKEGALFKIELPL
jgi:PAS domain S-box-containing protein